MQLNFSSDTILKCLTNFSAPCNWISAMTHLENVLESFKKDAIEFRLKQIWKSLTINSARCNWLSAKTQIENVLGGLQQDAIEFRLGHNLKVSWYTFNRIQLNFGWDTIWKCLRIISKVSFWISIKTHFGNAIQQFWYDEIEFGLRDNSQTS